MKNQLISDQLKIEKIAELLSYKYDELFAELGIAFTKTQKMYMGACPIHGGDNVSALNLYIDGHAVRGYWKCRTHHCEQIFKSTIIGFVRGILSAQRRGWQSQEDTKKIFSFTETLNWICKFLKVDITTLEVDTTELEKKKFVSRMEVFAKKKVEIEKGISREQVRAALQIPSKFFVDRGFSAKILDSFDVGLCTNKAKPMYNRVVVPIYNESKTTVVACTGRSLFSECQKCKMYHNPQQECPVDDPYKWIHYAKWRNSGNISSLLYNYWNAKKYVRDSKFIILVEGPADVWRLEELGVHNAVAILGLELLDEQQITLETSGALTVVILTDMDGPGRKSAEHIKTKLQKSYKVYVPELSIHDPGDLKQETFNTELKPLFDTLTRKIL